MFITKEIDSSDPVYSIILNQLKHNIVNYRSSKSFIFFDRTKKPLLFCIENDQIVKCNKIKEKQILKQADLSVFKRKLPDTSIYGYLNPSKQTFNLINDLSNIKTTDKRKKLRGAPCGQAKNAKKKSDLIDIIKNY